MAAVLFEVAGRIDRGLWPVVALIWGTTLTWQLAAAPGSDWTILDFIYFYKALSRHAPYELNLLPDSRRFENTRS